MHRYRYIDTWIDRKQWTGLDWTGLDWTGLDWNMFFLDFAEKIHLFFFVFQELLAAETEK